MIELPDQCPLCHKDWELIDEASGVGGGFGLFAEFRCPQYSQCYCSLYKDSKTGKKEWLGRFVGEFEIWWDIEEGIDYRDGNQEMFRVSFDLPFDVDEERLKLLLVFS